MTLSEPSPALQVECLSKTYRTWATPASRLWVPLLQRAAAVLRAWPRLAAALQRSVQRQVHVHQALQPLTFSLRRGEALGIIGANGSGKSTLLQLIAGVLPASSGQVQVNGRVAALLELGSGFNPELSGRENVRVNAAILGLSSTQTAERMAAIVAFADIGDYIDEPVKTYSSGMAVRLAFAVQVHVDPDILIVDEALAVGDAAFQAKAMAKVGQILEQGTTLLFVGHDLNVVKAFCHRAMLLEHGQRVMTGLPDEVITEYLHRSHLRSLQQGSFAQAGALKKLDDGFGFDDVRVVSATLNGVDHVAVGFDAPLQLDLQVRLRPDIAHPLLIVDVIDGRGLQLSGRRVRLPRVADAGEVRVQVALKASFQQGVYRFRLRLLDSADVTQHVVLARQEGQPSFELVDDSRERFTGIFPLPMTIAVTSAVAVADGC